MDATQDRFDRLWREAERNVAAVVGGHARQATREDREDLVQAVRLRAWRGFSAYDPEKPFAAWVCRIAIRACIDWHRANAKRPKIAPIEIEDWREADPSPSPLDLAALDELSPEMRTAIDSLPSILRTALLLRTAGFGHEKISEFADCPIGTVKSRIYHAMARLREILGPDFPATRG